MTAEVRLIGSNAAASTLTERRYNCERNGSITSFVIRCRFLELLEGRALSRPPC